MAIYHYTDTNITQLTGKINYHQQTIDCALIATDHFRRYFEAYKAEHPTLSSKLLEADFVKFYLDSLLYYVFIANRIAYFISQPCLSRTEPIYLSGIRTLFVASQFCCAQELVDELLALQANLSAPDGTYFLDAGWLGQLTVICEALDLFRNLCIDL